MTAVRSDIRSITFALSGPDDGHECWLGEYVDHLYPTCPLLARHTPNPHRGIGGVDPLGGGICGWCLRVWKARQS